MLLTISERLAKFSVRKAASAAAVSGLQYLCIYPEVLEIVSTRPIPRKILCVFHLGQTSRRCWMFVAGRIEDNNAEHIISGGISPEIVAYGLS